MPDEGAPRYRGRLAPTPTGYLHLGHARTFYLAAERAHSVGGVLIYRQEDLDQLRCREEYGRAAMEDLRWLGLDWQEGPDVGGDFAPYAQSERSEGYLQAWAHLRDAGAIYPCQRSRRELRAAASLTPPSPLTEDEQEVEPLYPSLWRPPPGTFADAEAPGNVNWRLRVPDGRSIAFQDAAVGFCAFVAGEDFGDFVIWRRDGVPAYELAVVVDDDAMGITEVVRGADLLRSTARQILLAEALGVASPRWCHLPLVRDAQGRRLAKRTAGLAVRELRERGWSAEAVLAHSGLKMSPSGRFTLSLNKRLP